MKIKHRLYIMFIGFIIISMLILEVINLNYYNVKIKEIIENDLTVSANIQIQAIDNFYEEREAELNIISKYDLVHSLINSSNKGEKITETIELRYLKDMFKTRSAENIYVESISVIDKNFNIVVSSADTFEGEVSVLKDTNPKYFNKKMIFTRVTESGQKGNTKRIIAAIMEIYNNEELIGYIVEEINLDFFNNIRTSANLYNNGTIYIVDDSKNIVTAGSKDKAITEYITNKDDRNDYSNAWAHRTGNTGILEYRINSDMYMTYYSTFKNLDWTMLTSINVSEIRNTKGILKSMGALLLIVFTVLFILLNKLLTEYLAKPIEHIIYNFKQIQANHDYSIRMKHESNNEIGLISKSINEVLDYIENYINEEKRKQKNLKNKAESDPMTQLYNKTTIEKIIKAELKSANEKGKSIALAFIDIDDFKEFNSKYGHIGGDKVIKFVADILKSSIYSAGRVGGDEFVLCINEDLDNIVISNIVEKIIATLEKGFDINGKGEIVSIKCSIGVAVSKNDGSTEYDELLEQSDKAMYCIKNSCKNSYYIVR